MTTPPDSRKRGKGRFSRLALMGALILGAGVPAAFAAITADGVTIDAKDPFYFPASSVTGTASINGVSQTGRNVELRLLKSGVQQGSIQTYNLIAGTNYGFTASISRACSPGAATWVTQVRFVNGAWDNSAGKNIPC